MLEQRQFKQRYATGSERFFTQITRRFPPEQRSDSVKIRHQRPVSVIHFFILSRLHGRTFYGTPVRAQGFSARTGSFLRQWFGSALEIASNLNPRREISSQRLIEGEDTVDDWSLN